MFQSASRVPEAADLSRRRSVLVDSPPRPLAAKRAEEQVSAAHSIVGGSAWEPTLLTVSLANQASLGEDASIFSFSKMAFYLRHAKFRRTQL